MWRRQSLGGRGGSSPFSKLGIFLAPESDSSEPAFQRAPMVHCAQSEDSSGMPSASCVKVFLVDDSVPIRQRVASLLARSPCSVVGEAGTPQASIEGILNVRPDVVVLDVQLEGGTGLQVLKAVRQADPGVAFVVFSNNANPAYRKRYLAEGALSFLDKSSEFDKLVEAVQSAAGQLTH